MNDAESPGLQKVLTALLLIQLNELDDAARFSILFRSGWTNAEVSTATGLSEGAVAVRRTRLKQKMAKERD